MASDTEVIHIRIDTVILDRVKQIEKNEDRHRAYIVQRLLMEALDARDAKVKGARKA